MSGECKYGDGEFLRLQASLGAQLTDSPIEPPIHLDGPQSDRLAIDM